VGDTRDTLEGYFSMKIATLAFSCVLVGLLAAGCGDDSDDSGSPFSANCQKLCTLTKPLNCPSDATDCVDYCESTAGLFPKCEAQIKAAYACAATKTTADFQCDDDGRFEPKDGVCQTEEDAVIACALGG
jgi:hypothetical protein